MISAKHVAHDRIKHLLTLALARAAPDGMFVGIEASLQLARDILVEPDITVISKSVYDVPPKTFAQPRPEDVLLLIEIAASQPCLRPEAEGAALCPARHPRVLGHRCERTVTWIHTGASGDGWSSDCGARTARHARHAGAAEFLCPAWRDSHDHSAAWRPLSEPPIELASSSPAASAITVPGGKIASAPACSQLRHNPAAAPRRRPRS